MALDLHLTPECFDTTRFAGRHLAQERLIDWIPAMRNASDFKHGVVPWRAHVSGVLTKGTFHLQTVYGHSPLDHDFRRSGDLQIDRETLNHLDGFAANAA